MFSRLLAGLTGDDETTSVESLSARSHASSRNHGVWANEEGPWGGGGEGEGGAASFYTPPRAVRTPHHSEPGTPGSGSPRGVAPGAHAYPELDRLRLELRYQDDVPRDTNRSSSGAGWVATFDDATSAGTGGGGDAARTQRAPSSGMGGREAGGSTSRAALGGSPAPPPPGPPGAGAGASATGTAPPDLPTGRRGRHVRTASGGSLVASRSYGELDRARGEDGGGNLAAGRAPGGALGRDPPPTASGPRSPVRRLDSPEPLARPPVASFQPRPSADEAWEERRRRATAATATRPSRPADYPPPGDAYPPPLGTYPPPTTSSPVQRTAMTSVSSADTATGALPKARAVAALFKAAAARVQAGVVGSTEVPQPWGGGRVDGEGSGPGPHPDGPDGARDPLAPPRLDSRPPSRPGSAQGSAERREARGGDVAPSHRDGSPSAPVGAGAKPLAAVTPGGTSTSSPSDAVSEAWQSIPFLPSLVSTLIGEGHWGHSSSGGDSSPDDAWVRAPASEPRHATDGAAPGRRADGGDGGAAGSRAPARPPARRSTADEAVAVPLVPAPRARGPPALSEASRLLSTDEIAALATAAPLRYRTCAWTLAYASWRDGVSLASLMRAAAGKAPTVLVVRDASRGVFGAYCSEPWRAAPRYYGTGETFVFRAAGDVGAAPARWPWWHERAAVERNDFFMWADHECIAVGGAGGYAIRLDAELFAGVSRASRTFGNDPLSAQGEEFQIGAVELWSLA